MKAIEIARQLHTLRLSITSIEYQIAGYNGPKPNKVQRAALRKQVAAMNVQADELGVELTEAVNGDMMVYMNIMDAVRNNK